MKVKKGGRRQFLKQSAAMASLAVGGTSLVSGQNMVSEGLRPGRHLPYGVPSRFETTNRDYFNRGGRYSMTGSAGTPLQDLDGIITSEEVAQNSADRPTTADTQGDPPPATAMVALTPSPSKKLSCSATQIAEKAKLGTDTRTRTSGNSFWA